MSENEKIITFDAAVAFKDSLIPSRDGEHFVRPVWHEWAIVEAFLAGAKYARAETAEAVSLNLSVAAIQPVPWKAR